MPQLNGIYLGVVEKVNDPERLGRVKVRVPAVYGVLGGVVGAVPVDSLPWAIPMGVPVGESTSTGGADWLPTVGDQVAVQFLDGEPEKPVWTWLMQTTGSAETFKLHQYEEQNGEVADPKRSAWTRYGHTVEWNQGSLVVTTSEGYRLFILDGTANDGRISMETAIGQYLEFDDTTFSATINTLEDFYMQIGVELNIQASNIRLETVNDVDFQVGTSFDITTVGDFTLTSEMGINLEYGTQLLLGAGSTEAFVKGNQLSALLNNLFTYLAAHTHTNGNDGSPTGPPIIPPIAVVQPSVELITSQTIFGQ